MSFLYEMASNSSQSSMITPCELKLSFESVSEFLLWFIVSTSTLLTTVGLMVYKIDHCVKITNHNITMEFRKSHKI